MHCLTTFSREQSMALSSYPERPSTPLAMVFMMSCPYSLKITSLTKTPGRSMFFMSMERKVSVSSGDGSFPNSRR